VYIEFETEQQAVTAANDLGGRTFSGRVVITSYYDEAKFAADQLE
jgi:hypothetical protein